MAKLSGWSYISQLGLMKPLNINKHGNFVHIYNVLSLSLSLFLSATYPSSQHAKLQNVESQKLSSPQLILTFFIFPSSLLLQLLGEVFWICDACPGRRGEFMCGEGNVIAYMLLFLLCLHWTCRPRS